jgi:hypothetical protein
VVLFRRFAARTRIKRASAEALSQPLFGMRRQSSIDSSAIDLPSGTAPPVAATQAGAPAPRSMAVAVAAEPVSERQHHAGAVVTLEAYGLADPYRPDAYAQWLPDCPNWRLTRRAYRRQRRRRRRVGAA